MRLTALMKVLALAIVPAVLATGCEDASILPTAPITGESVAIDVYAVPLDPGGSSRYLATLETDMSLQVTLAGEQVGSPVQTLDLPLKVDISNWDGSDCTTIVEAVVTPRLTAHLQQYLKAGTYCIRVSDPGTLTQSIGTILKVSYPAPKNLNGTTSPATLSSIVVPGGSTSKSFTTSTDGTINITLNSLGSSAPARLGIGVLASSSSGCTLTKVVDARPGNTPQLSVIADAGPYCAIVLDGGGFTGPTSFTVTATHP